MRRSRFSLFVLTSLLLLSTPKDVLGREVCSVSPDPDDDIALKCEDGTDISAYLEQSSCGGSDKSISLVGNTGNEKEDANRPQLGSESFIAKVVGVPGREGQPLGDIFSGMAKRNETGGKYNDGFQYPNSAQGFATTCEPDKFEEEKAIFHCKDGSPDGTIDCNGGRDAETIGYPYFEDPICRWRLEADEDGNARKTIDPDPYTKDDFDQIEDGQTPPLCLSMCEYLNQWQYYDCIETTTIPGFGTYCDRWGYRYICNDQEVLSDGACGSENFGDYDWPNASACVGENCRCGGVDRESCKRTDPPPGDVGEADMPYRSYFRGYSASYERKEMEEHLEDDKAKEENVPVACYGFYEEFDPRYEQTTSGDFRCVIDIDVSERDDTQTGKGNFLSEVKDQSPPEPEPFDKKKDLWWEMIASGFSHLTPKQLDLSVALSDLKLAKIRAMPQVETTRPEDLGMAPGGMIRDFDDTGPLRTVVRWWRKQETVMNSVLTPPTLRVVNAPAWVMGLNSDDPLFKDPKSSSSSSTSSEFLGPRERPVDQQIHARDDQIGEILSYLDRTLLTVEEEPLPVLVPAGSPVEFRARAQALCTWYIGQNPEAENCDEAPENIKKTIDALEDFALRIDQVRRLREQLAEIAGELLKSQRAFSEPLQAWSKKNLKTYKDYLEQRNKVFALQTEWQKTQKLFREFHEKTNVPWCRNDRFTTAIYSLLDPWLTTRPQKGNSYEHTYEFEVQNIPEQPKEGLVGGDEDMPRAPTDLPSLADVAPRVLPDVVIDLSIFKGVGAPLKIPVLKVTQVPFDLERYQPPAPGGEARFPEPPELPPLEKILEIMKDTKKALPKLCGPEPEKDESGSASSSVASTSQSASTGSNGSASSEDDEESCHEGTNPPPLEEPELWTDEELAAIGGTLNLINSTITSMNKTYKDFWDSLNPEGNEDIEKEKDILKCKDWQMGICMHVEMDLLERFTRIAARPGILLKEDFDSRGAPRGASMVCLPDDHVCRLLNPDYTEGKIGWQVVPMDKSASSSSSGGSRGSNASNRSGGSQQSGASGGSQGSGGSGASQGSGGSNGSKTTVEELRERLRKESLPEPIGSLDPDTFPPYVVDPDELLRIFEVPKPIELKMQSSSSSGGRPAPVPTPRT